MAGQGSDPAIGLIEASSIARGIKTADAMVKKASVRLLRCQTVSPGKHLTLISGGVDEVFEAMREGDAIAQETRIDRLFLPQVDISVLDAIEGDLNGRKAQRSFGVIECFSVASTIVAADAAAKAAEVSFVEMRLG